VALLSFLANSFFAEYPTARSVYQLLASLEAARKQRRDVNRRKFHAEILRLAITKASETHACVGAPTMDETWVRPEPVTLTDVTGPASASRPGRRRPRGQFRQR
jgi:hypothetical protein